MGEVHVAFGIHFDSLFHVTFIVFFTMHMSSFHIHKVLYFLWFFLPSNVWTPFGSKIFSSSTFTNSLFPLTPPSFKCVHVFLGPRTFDSFKGPLAHKQASLSITFGGVWPISTSTITPTNYLGSWAFVASIIAIRFMVDQCPFIIEALTWVNNNIFFSTTLQGDMWSSTTFNICMFSSIWTTHWSTNGSTSRFHFRVFAPSCLFQHDLQRDI